MPDWNLKDLKEIKEFILLFVKAMNEKKIEFLESIYDENAVLHREAKNYKGLSEIISWYKKMWDYQGFSNSIFKLKDATSGILPNCTAKCILWFEISVPNSEQKNIKKKQIHIETIDLEKHQNEWKIVNCIGLGYDPVEHDKYFN